MGLGFLSLLTESDIIMVPGLGQLPGIVGMVLAVAVFALTLWMVLAAPRPSYVSTVFLALGTTLAHLGGIWATALAEGVGVARATAPVGHLVLGGGSAVIAFAALVAAWAGIALRRTRARQPHWPWESPDED
ncbi:hypothetical protein J2Y69_001293 [Microbacterium resistens]|uniref:Uncharacterized protein n=1 Tax=Microbacterium resistens TaxID=156977 RepID=A0ABU1SAU5_9MICO|nr:hypothetical protein [Microbacterium resistens]MDR6866700.1 hypothetical protein [Microbacterium resistens]